MDVQLQISIVPAAPVASTSTTSSPLPTLTPSDSEKLLAALLSRHNIPLEPLDFWEREFAWLSYQTNFVLETEFSTLFFDIMQEYVIVHSPFLKIKQEDRLVLGSHNTFADGLLYVKRRSIIGRQPDVYIPLSVFELKSGLGGGNGFRQSAIAQLFSAMRGRLWSGDPPYNASWGRLDTRPAQLSRHTPIFGYQFGGTSGRRMIALSPELFFIDTKDTKKNRHVVSYEMTEWTTHLYDQSRVLLDQHVQILRKYAEFIKNLPNERDIEAYGELASVPIADRTKLDGWSRAVHDDPAAMGMARVERPPSQEGAVEGENHDQHQDDGEEGNGSSRGGGARRGGNGDNPTGSKKARSRGPEGGEGALPPKKRQHRQSETNKDALALPHLSEPSDVASDETDYFLNTPAVTEGASPIQHASSSSQGKSTPDQCHLNVNLDAGHDNIPSVRQDLFCAEECDPKDDKLVYDEMAGEYYIPVTKEMDDEMRRCIRPMWTMTTEERKRVFGFLGPDWEPFATWYVGCPVVTG